jgi:hypothetical protein
MIKYLTPLAFAIGLSGAHADEIKPLSAQPISIGTVHGVAYFTQELDGFRVVATLADGEGGKPIRLIATLADGQNVRMSVPNGNGEAEQAVELFRDGDVLGMRDPLEALTASIK